MDFHFNSFFEIIEIKIFIFYIPRKFNLLHFLLKIKFSQLCCRDWNRKIMIFNWNFDLKNCSLLNNCQHFFLNNYSIYTSDPLQKSSKFLLIPNRSKSNKSIHENSKIPFNHKQNQEISSTNMSHFLMNEIVIKFPRKSRFSSIFSFFFFWLSR